MAFQFNPCHPCCPSKSVVIVPNPCGWPCETLPVYYLATISGSPFPAPVWNVSYPQYQSVFYPCGYNCICPLWDASYLLGLDTTSPSTCYWRVPICHDGQTSTILELSADPNNFYVRVFYALWDFAGQTYDLATATIPNTSWNCLGSNAVTLNILNVGWGDSNHPNGVCAGYPPTLDMTIQAIFPLACCPNGLPSTLYVNVIQDAGTNVMYTSPLTGQTFSDSPCPLMQVMGGGTKFPLVYDPVRNYWSYTNNNTSTGYIFSLVLVCESTSPVGSVSDFKLYWFYYSSNYWHDSGDYDPTVASPGDGATCSPLWLPFTIHSPGATCCTSVYYGYETSGGPPNPNVVLTITDT